MVRAGSLNHPTLFDTQLGLSICPLDEGPRPRPPKSSKARTFFLVQKFEDKVGPDFEKPAILRAGLEHDSTLP